MSIVKIHSVDSTWSEIDREGYLILNKHLSYTKIYWVNIGFKKQRKEYTKYLITKSSGKYWFLTGLVKKCLLFLQENGHEYKYTSDIPAVNYDAISLKGIKLRDYQEEIIHSLIACGRGVCKSATGSGKSICIMGIVSSFSMENILILVNSSDLVKQLFDDLERFGFDPCMYSGSEKQVGRVTVATVQSYKKIALDYADFWDVCIVDECHFIKSIESKTFGYVLQRVNAGVKIGFTATLPIEKEAQFALEGLLGPEIYDYSIVRATEEGVLAKPIVYILETAPFPEVARLKDYRQAYTHGIALNSSRNKQIVDIAIKMIKEGRIILLLIQRILHGETLVDMFAKRGYNIEFVQGNTDKDNRSILKEKLKEKKIKCLIASTVFATGIDIPSISCLLNASGSKSDLTVLQKVGRGLRTAEGKDDVVIIDFLDRSHKWFKRHSRKRLELYKSQNWEIINVY